MTQHVLGKVTNETINPNEILFSLLDYSEKPKNNHNDSDATPDLSLDGSFSNQVVNTISAVTNNKKNDIDSDETPDLSLDGSFSNEVVNTVPTNHQHLEIDSHVITDLSFNSNKLVNIVPNDTDRDVTPQLSLDGSLRNEVVNIIPKLCAKNNLSQQTKSDSLKSSQSSLTFARKTSKNKIKRYETNKNGLKQYYSVVKKANYNRSVSENGCANVLDETENETLVHKKQSKTR